jgi:hypothetical protein
LRVAKLHDTNLLQKMNHRPHVARATILQLSSSAMSFLSFSYAIYKNPRLPFPGY